MSKSIFLLSAFVALTSTLACSDDRPRPGEALTPERVDELCAATCEFGVACDPDEFGATMAECRTECDPIASLYRADVFEDLAACLTEATCSQWLSDRDRCDHVVDETTPTPAGESYLASCAAVVARCSGPDSEPCEPIMGRILNDQILGEFTACFNADSCDEMERCSLAVTRKYNLDD